MPTTQVGPGSEPLLQDIANSLWKSRKVVVITGAGISTNSGIPDFRSENGLYSLIQAQFDAVAANEASQATNSSGSSNVDLDVSNTSFETADERPTKRRRLSRHDGETAPPRSTNDGHPMDLVPVQAASEQMETQGGPHSSAGNVEAAQALPQTVAEEEPEFPALPTTLKSGALSCSHLGDPQDVAMLDVEGSEIPTKGLQLIPDQSFSRRMSSSPLSSPPPTLFNPYPESTSTFDSSSEQSNSSSRSESEEPSSASTPLLTSQSSFGSSSGRNSLPNIKGRDLFDSQIWSCPTKTSVFYTFATTLRQKVRHATPTSSHHFLEERVGLSTSLSLGAGSRYRFSARAGRQSTGVRNIMAKQEAAETPAQGESQEGGQEDGPEAQEPLLGEEKARVPPAAPTSADPGGPSDSQQRVVGSAPPSAVLARGASLTTSTPTPPNRGVECVFLHGSLAELRCFVCGRTSSWDEDSRQSDTLAGRQPTCPHCAGATAAREERGKRALGVGKLRPDIVLYGEEHPHAHLISPIIQHDLSLGPDMLLILGTSMRVHGLKVLVKEFAKAVHDRGGKVVFVNFTKPPDSVWADVLDYWVQWDCDAWVGDLQHRKPALFLPPGTVLPEDEKKPARASRRTSGGDTTKQKSSSTNKRRETGGSSSKTQRDSIGSSITVIEDGIEVAELPSEVMAPPRSSRARKDGKEPGEPREPKLNPNAKRPASIRDHKLNGAFLVWKIMGELRRVTGRATTPSDASSANEKKPKAAPKTRRSRRSAPAALESEDKDTTAADIGVVMHEPENEPEEQIAEPETAVSEEVESETKVTGTDEHGTSISALVKSRKRKRTAWKMVRGVETRVPVEDDRDEVPPLPHTDAVFKPRATPNPGPEVDAEPQPQDLSSSSLPVEATVAPIAATAPPKTKPRKQVKPKAKLDALPRTEAVFKPLLKPKAAPSTPALTKPEPKPKPRALPKAMTPANSKPASRVATPIPTQPKVTSPGPLAEIAPDVGSPAAVRPGSGNNPFSYADPLGRQLSFPPTWLGGVELGAFHHHGYYQPMEQMQTDGGEHGHYAGRLTSEAHGLSHGYDGPVGQYHEGHGYDGHVGPFQPGHPFADHGYAAPGGQYPEGPGDGFGGCHHGLVPGYEVGHYDEATASGGGGRSTGPEEQLQKEQEAAMMLSLLRGGGGC
ncbi:hypothetical protein B0T22DRAFT_380471 [Podospora appendiculata]|uniref:Deacetylase sirtuin-type domain-containing protein n=1 Tax=Podospora appendiculata TaxID=314037 RepID=A0AAE1CCJ0_9PEZI|nr:hypothetical protein B0T22DRAFT_380471 [Podospora appendiculata]